MDHRLPAAQAIETGVNLVLQQSSIDQATNCPKCGTELILAASVPHTINARMERRTFVCVKCNQTRTYIVPAE